MGVGEAAWDGRRAGKMVCEMTGKGCMMRRSFEATPVHSVVDAVFLAGEALWPNTLMAAKIQP
jgi:hypothetical protein